MPDYNIPDYVTCASAVLCDEINKRHKFINTYFLTFLKEQRKKNSEG